MSEIGRLSGVILDPASAFADIATRPRWLPPLFVVLCLAMSFTYFLSQRVGWEPVIRQAIETNSRTQSLPAEQKEQIIQQQAKVTSIVAYVGPPVATPLMALAIAGVLLGVFKMMGGDLTFRQSFAVTAYSFLTGVVGTGVALLVLFLKPPEDFNIQNPIGFNIGAYLDPNATPKWLLSIGTSIDAFSIWTVLLLALGFSIASKTVSFGKALVGVAIPWILLILGKAGWAAMFS